MKKIAFLLSVKGKPIRQEGYYIQIKSHKLVIYRLAQNKDLIERNWRVAEYTTGHGIMFEKWLDIIRKKSLTRKEIVKLLPYFISEVVGEKQFKSQVSAKAVINHNHE